MRLSSATDDPVHGDAGKKSCCGIGEASQQGNWFVFGPKLSSDVARLEWIISHDMCEEPKRGKLEKHRGVYMFGDGTHGRSTVVPKSQSGKEMQYRCSWKRVRKHVPFPRK